MTPEQFDKIAPHLVNFLMEKYGRYKDSSYDSDERRVWLGIVAGFGEIGEKAAEANLKPVVSSIVEILGSALNSIDGTGWIHETSAEALGEIGETLMLSEIEGCEDIARRITALLRGYINDGMGFSYVVIAEPAKTALQQLGASEVEPDEADIISGLIKQFRQSPDPESKIGIIGRLHRIGLHAVRALQAATRRDPAALKIIEDIVRELDRAPSAAEFLTLRNTLREAGRAP